MSDNADLLGGVHARNRTLACQRREGLEGLMGFAICRDQAGRRPLTAQLAGRAHQAAED